MEETMNHENLTPRARRSSLVDPGKKKDDHERQRRRVRLSVEEKPPTEGDTLIVSASPCNRDADLSTSEIPLLDDSQPFITDTVSNRDSSEMKEDVKHLLEELNTSHAILTMKKTVRLGMLTVNNTYMTEFLLTSKMCGGICSEIFGDANRFFRLHTLKNPQPPVGHLHIELFHVGKTSRENERNLDPPKDSHKFVQPMLYDTPHDVKERILESGGEKDSDSPCFASNTSHSSHRFNRYSISHFIRNHAEASQIDEDTAQDLDSADEIEEVGKDFVGLGFRITFCPTSKGPFTVSWTLDIVEDFHSAETSKAEKDSRDVGIDDQKSAIDDANTALSPNSHVVAKIELTINGQCIDKWAGKPLLKINVHEIAKGLDNISDAETIQAL